MTSVVGIEGSRSSSLVAFSSTAPVSCSWTAPPSNRYKVKARDSLTAVSHGSFVDSYEVKTRDSRSDSASEVKSAVSSVLSHPPLLIDSDARENTRLRTLGIKLLKRFNELDERGEPIYPVRMLLSNFVEWVGINVEALNECARLVEQADTITEIFKSNLIDRGKEVIPLIPCIKLSTTTGQKGDFPTIELVPFHLRGNYIKQETGYFSAEALPEVNEAKQRVLTSKEEVDAIVVEAAKSAGITWEYKGDGCELRARTLYEALRCMGIAAKSMILQYYIGKDNRFGWKYHVALAIKLGNGQLLVLDPSLDSSAAMTVEDWIRKFHNNAEYKLKANNFLKLDAEVFHISCNQFLLYNDDSSHLTNRVDADNYTFFKTYSNRTGLFSVISQLLKSLTNASRLGGLLQEICEKYWFFCLPSVWQKFECLHLFDIKIEEAQEPKLVFNFTLDEIKSLTWQPQFKRIGLSKSRVIDLFKRALNCSRGEMNRWNARPKPNIQTMRALQCYIDELLKKVENLQKA